MKKKQSKIEHILIKAGKEELVHLPITDADRVMETINSFYESAKIPQGGPLYSLLRDKYFREKYKIDGFSFEGENWPLYGFTVIDEESFAVLQATYTEAGLKVRLPDHKDIWSAWNQYGKRYNPQFDEMAQALYKHRCPGRGCTACAIRLIANAKEETEANDERIRQATQKANERKREQQKNNQSV